VAVERVDPPPEEQGALTMHPSHITTRQRFEAKRNGISITAYRNQRLAGFTHQHIIGTTQERLAHIARVRSEQTDTRRILAAAVAAWS
jgi:hypothetical protein